jgi:hypothetical protein
MGLSCRGRSNDSVDSSSVQRRWNPTQQLEAGRSDHQGGWHGQYRLPSATVEACPGVSFPSPLFFLFLPSLLRRFRRSLPPLLTHAAHLMTSTSYPSAGSTKRPSPPTSATQAKNWVRYSIKPKRCAPTPPPAPAPCAKSVSRNRCTTTRTICCGLEELDSGRLRRSSRSCSTPARPTSGLRRLTSSALDARGTSTIRLSRRPRRGGMATLPVRSLPLLFLRSY